jgi:hypothetical protein
VGNGTVNRLLNFASQRIYFLDVISDFIVFSSLRRILENKWLENIEVAIKETGNHLAVILHHACIELGVRDNRIARHFKVCLGINLHLLRPTKLCHQQHGSNHQHEAPCFMTVSCFHLATKLARILHKMFIFSFYNRDFLRFLVFLFCLAKIFANITPAFSERIHIFVAKSSVRTSTQIHTQEKKQ